MNGESQSTSLLFSHTQARNQFQWMSKEKKTNKLIINRMWNLLIIIFMTGKSWREFKGERKSDYVSAKIELTISSIMVNVHSSAFTSPSFTAQPPIHPQPPHWILMTLSHAKRERHTTSFRTLAFVQNDEAEGEERDENSFILAIVHCVCCCLLIIHHESNSRSFFLLCWITTRLAQLVFARDFRWLEIVRWSSNKLSVLAVWVFSSSFAAATAIVTTSAAHSPPLKDSNGVDRDDARTLQMWISHFFEQYERKTFFALLPSHCTQHTEEHSWSVRSTRY